MKILIYYMPIYFLLLFVVSFYFVVCEKNKKNPRTVPGRSPALFLSLSSRTAPAHWPFSPQLRARPKRLRLGRPLLSLSPLCH